MKNIVASLALWSVILLQASPATAQEATLASTSPVVKGIYVEVERGLLVESRLTRATGPYLVEIQRPGRDKSEFIRLPAGVQPAHIEKSAVASSAAAGASSALPAGKDSLRTQLAGTPDCIPGAPVR